MGRLEKMPLLKRTLVVPLALALSACGSSGGTKGGAPVAPPNPNKEACEFLVANQDGVAPTADELAELDRLATPELAQDTRVLTELQESDNPADLQALVEVAMRVRAECANNGVVIPTGGPTGS